MSILVLDEVEAVRVVNELAGWVLAFDEPADPTVQDEAVDGSFLLVDSVPAVTVLASPQDFLLIDGPTLPPKTLDSQTFEDILLITAGGPPGSPGAAGPQGPPGADGVGTSYEMTQNFATPSTLWVINHNFGTYGLEVDCFDFSGDLIEGSVAYPSDNSIEVEWYYPTAGMARVWR